MKSIRNSLTFKPQYHHVQLAGFNGYNLYISILHASWFMFVLHQGVAMVTIVDFLRCCGLL